MMPKHFAPQTSRTPQPLTRSKKKKPPTTHTGTQLDIQRALMNPNPSTLTPDVISSLQQSHGNQYVTQLIQTMRDPNQQTIQRDDDENMVSKGATIGDIGGALVGVYEAYHGDDSANSILKAITEFSGNYADTSGAVGDISESSGKLGKPNTVENVGSWAKFTGGLYSMGAKGYGLLSGMGEYAMSGAKYLGMGGYTTEKLEAAGSWIGGWAKSAGEYLSPYEWFVDAVGAGAKGISGVTEGWALGYVLQDLAELAKSGQTGDTKNAAKMLFDMVWWKKVASYGKGAVGAIEGGSLAAAIWFGPMSKGITVLTKTYESGWGTYLLRAIGSSITGSVYSNAQVKQKADQDKNLLLGYVNNVVATGKVKDIVGLYKAADAIGLDEFKTKIEEAFDHPPSGKEQRYTQRKIAFQEQLNA